MKIEFKIERGFDEKPVYLSLETEADNVGTILPAPGDEGHYIKMNFPTCYGNFLLSLEKSLQTFMPCTVYCGDKIYEGKYLALSALDANPLIKVLNTKNIEEEKK